MRIWCVTGPEFWQTTISTQQNFDLLFVIFWVLCFYYFKILRTQKFEDNVTIYFSAVHAFLGRFKGFHLLDRFSALKKGLKNIVRFYTVYFENVNFAHDLVK